MSESMLPAHLRNKEHLKAFEDIWNERVGTIDISQTMMYFVDKASPKALPFLAKQFNIVTLRSWKLASTDAERRLLIKNAIATRSVVGTVAAVKTAIASLGFDPSHLVERCGTDPVTGWAEFKMAFSSGELSILDGSLHELLMQLINDTKPVRCKYIGLDYSVPDITDAVTVTDSVTVAAATAIVDAFDLSNFKLDGTYKLDGSKKLKRGCEDVQFVVI